MRTASARPDPNAPFARAEIIVRGLTAPPSSPAFQLRRSTVDYVEPNLDLTGWTRAEVVLLPLDAWWAEGERSFHLLVSGLLCQFIDPGPLRLRLPGAGGGEMDLFWPEDISVYDDGLLASHARVLTDTVRIVGREAPSPEPVRAATPPAPPPEAEVVTPSPWGLPPTPAAPVIKRRRRGGSWSILLPVVLGAMVVGAVATRHQTGLQAGRFTAPPPRDPATGINVPRAQPQEAPTMRAVLERVVDELTGGRRGDFDPFLAVRSTSEIISQATTPEALLRYGTTKLDQREPAGADRLFEEATRPRFGPGQNRPYAPAFVTRGLLYDPSLQHELILPVPNAGFAETLYRRAISSGDPEVAAYGNRYLQRLVAWEGQRANR